MLLAHNVGAGNDCEWLGEGVYLAQSTKHLLPFDYKTNLFEIHLNNSQQK